MKLHLFFRRIEFDSLREGYTAVGYLCEQILCRFDGLTDEQIFQDDRLETIFQLLERVPKDQLIIGSRIIVAEQTTENLFFTVCQQLIELKHPLYEGSMFNRHASMSIHTADDHRYYARRLLRYHRWHAAIAALRDTHDVDISETVLRFLAKDPNSSLTQLLSPGSDLSLFCVLIFYGLASRQHFFHSLTPICSAIGKDLDTNVSSQQQDRFQCSLSFDNVNLHASYVTLLHSCVHDATWHVYKLKHWSRLYLRRYLRIEIRNKLDHCSDLNEEQRDYVSFKAISLIYSEMTELFSILQLIKHLVRDNIDRSKGRTLVLFCIALVQHRIDRKSVSQSRRCSDIDLRFREFIDERQ